MVKNSPVAEVYLDESGHDGENLVGGSTRVFAYAGLHMELNDAFEIVQYIRKEIRAQGPELKARQVIKHPRLVDYLYGENGVLVGKAKVYLADKHYVAVGKIVDTLIEEMTHEAGINIYAKGQARSIAVTLYREGPAALGQAGWNELLSAFTSLMRLKQRKAGPKETVDGFYQKIHEYRTKAAVPVVTETLDLLWRTREYAEEFQRTIIANSSIPSLDIMLPSLSELAFWWHKKLDRPIKLIHDKQTHLSRDMIRLLQVASNFGTPASYNLSPRRLALSEVTSIDSKADPRIQLADITAGHCREAAEGTLQRQADVVKAEQLRRLIHGNSLWADEKSWEMIRPI